MKKSKKREPNYRIIRIGDDGKKVTMIKFWAPDDKGALAYLHDYKKAANRAYTYYWDICSLVKVVSSDGKTVESYDTLEDMWLAGKQSWWSKAWDNIAWYACGWWLNKLDDFKWWLADMWYFAKHKQYRRASWSLDGYVLETLKHNVKILLKQKHGISQQFVDEARRELHKADKGFDLRKYSAEHPNVTPEEEKLSLEIQEKAFKQLIGAIDRYTYYMEQGMVEDKALDKELRSTLPLRQGSYDALDYAKLYAMAQKQWCKIWDWMKQYGQTLWD